MTHKGFPITCKNWLKPLTSLYELELIYIAGDAQLNVYLTLDKVINFKLKL